ncbi:MAG: KpsF/GutQ family sugar-phosphate isomerase [Verrucomicrobiota bacterium]|nr:KpsF/GutQ family sugar-phosphate isomerase [Verrucomicrobiota bacterium]
MSNYLKNAKEVIDIEIEGLKDVRDKLGEEFNKTVDACLETLANRGKIVLTGIGKSGHIGYKLSATLSSTGSRSAFLNPVEAMHGDLGMLAENDIIIALSYSGETEELLTVIPAIKRFGVRIIAITGDINSRLADFADIILPMRVEKEACPFNLAPTATTTALLALGDALAITLLKQQNFSKEDYGKFHPGGAIGKSVTLRIKDIMRSKKESAIVHVDSTVGDCLMEMSSKRCGSAIIENDNSMLLGIFTDGDFRRQAQEGMDGLLTKLVKTVMTADPIAVEEDAMAVTLMNLLEKIHIDDIPVIDKNGCVAGLVDIQDLPRFKLM